MCLAGVWFMAVELLTLIQLRSGTMHDPLLAPGWVVLAAATIALALIGRDRLAGLGALAYMGLRLGDVMANDVSTLRLAAGLIPVACFVAMVLAPRRRGVPPGASRIGIAAAMLATNVGLAVIRVPTASSADAAGDRRRPGHAGDCRASRAAAAGQRRRLNRAPRTGRCACATRRRPRARCPSAE
jgi:hypothetical protein